MNRQRKVVTLVTCAVGIVIIATIGAYFAVQRSTAFEIADAYTASLPEIQALGAPVQLHLKFFGYSMQVTDSAGTARFSIVAKGLRGKAVVYVNLRKDLGHWEVVNYRVEPEDI